MPPRRPGTVEGVYSSVTHITGSSTLSPSGRRLRAFSLGSRSRQYLVSSSACRRILRYQDHRRKGPHFARPHRIDDGGRSSSSRSSAVSDRGSGLPVSSGGSDPLMMRISGTSSRRELFDSSAWSSDLLAWSAGRSGDPESKGSSDTSSHLSAYHLVLAITIRCVIVHHHVGRITLGFRRGRQRERGTSGRCLPSPANPCSAQSWVALVSSLGFCESADVQNFPGMHGPNIVLGQG